jgi:multicomponent Na+:H+ antiporter subunit B
MGELAILFAAATAAGLVLGHPGKTDQAEEAGGFILRAGADLLFPLLIVVGMYIILHGHLTPGGGFQGGVVLATAFVLPVLARPGQVPSHGALAIVEGLAGAVFIATGAAALAYDRIPDTRARAARRVRRPAHPHLAVGLKVGAELAAC